MGLISRSRDARHSHDLSNALSRGEIRDFAEAMGAVIDGMAAEHRESVRWNESLGPDEQALKWDYAAMDAYGDAAREAMRLYAAEMEQVKKRVAEQLRAKGSGEFEQIADALESGEYSGLAW